MASRISEFEFIEDTKKNLIPLREQNLFTDVVIECGQEKFPAHKVVLATHSPMLRAMFTSGMKESTEKLVKIQFEIPTQVIRLLKYMYSGDLDISDETLELLHAAKYLQMKRISDNCCLYLTKNLNSDNFISVWDAFDLYEELDNVLFIVDVIAAEFSSYIFTPNFPRLTIVRFKQILQSSQLNADGDSPLKALIRWLEFDYPEREDFFTELVSVVDFSQVSSESLVYAITNEPLISQSSPLLKFLSGILIKSTWRSDNIFTQWTFVYTGKTLFTPYCIILHITAFDRAMRTTTPTNYVEINCNNFFVTACNFKSLLIFLSQTTTIIYDIVKRQQTSLNNSPHLPTAAIPKSVICGDYVCYITEEKIVRGKLQNFAGVWEIETLLPERFVTVHVIVYQNELYLIGKDKKMIVYNTYKNQWVPSPVMPEWGCVDDSSKCFSAVVDSTLYLLHNFCNETLHLYCYDSFPSGKVVKYEMELPTQSVVDFNVTKDVGDIFFQIVEDCGTIWEKVNKPDEKWKEIINLSELKSDSKFLSLDVISKK